MISVCIATYNGASYIEEQVRSILGQLSSFDEVIISDDGSVDATLDIIESINDSRIKIVQSTARNVSHNFQNAILVSKGDYIFLADQDDVWMPNKVNIITAALENYTLVCHDGFVVSSDKKLLYDSIHLKPKLKFIYNLVSNRTYTGCCMAFRRELLDYTLPFPRKEILHDWWIGLLADLYNVKRVYLDDKLILYRRHTDNVSSFRKSGLSVLVKLKLRFWVLTSIICRKQEK